MRCASLALLLLATGCTPAALPNDAGVTPEACASQGRAVGAQEGELLPPIPVTTCDGVETTLRAIACGAPLTLLDVGAATFRRCVEASDLYATDPDFAALKERGLNIVQVFTTDADFQPASPEFCRDYVAEHAIDFTFVVDPSAFTDGLSEVHPLNLVLNSAGEIVHKWVGDPPEDRLQILSDLLGDL